MLRTQITARRHLQSATVDLVDVALVLAADSSGSISSGDLALQFHGYAQAITSETFIAAVRLGRHGRIVLTFVAWSDARRQDQLVPWSLIDGVPAAQQFAAALLSASAPIPGYTSISGAIDFSQELLWACEYPATSRVIDISGDGRNNDGRHVNGARDDAVAVGIRINGLAIIRKEPDLATYYTQNVIGGPSAFVTVVKDLASFESALLGKLIREIATAPGA